MEIFGMKYDATSVGVLDIDPNRQFEPSLWRLISMPCILCRYLRMATLYARGLRFPTNLSIVATETYERTAAFDGKAFADLDDVSRCCGC